jgi:hypothetical protein
MFFKVLASHQAQQGMGGQPDQLALAAQAAAMLGMLDLRTNQLAQAAQAAAMLGMLDLRTNQLALAAQAAAMLGMYYVRF